MNKLYGLVLLCFLSIESWGQTEEQTIQRQILEQQQNEHARVTRIMDEGVALMDEEKYEEADVKFKEVLKNSKVVPTDLTFYFGKNSFHLGLYQQSIDWLNKYLQLKGTTGQFSKECSEYLEKANEAFVLLRKEEREEAKRILTTSYDIDCGPTGKVICPVCMGKGVIIQRGTFGDTYRTCPYSDDHGYLTCEEYNKLLRGELKPKF